MKNLIKEASTIFVKKVNIEMRVVPSFNVAWHFHEEFELVYVTKSNGMRFVGDSVSPFYPGDLVLVGANLPHLWRSDSFYYNEGNPENSKRVKTIVTKFTEDFLGINFFEAPEFQKINKLLKASKYGLFFGEEVSIDLHDLIVSLPSLPKTEQYIKLLEVLYQLSLVKEKDRLVLSSSNMRQSTKESPERIDTVLRYISDNYSSKMNLSDVADVACMTTNSFCRFFKKTTNKSFTQFLNEIRIRNASRILIQQKIPISEVCYSVGFNSITNFNKQFKLLVGSTPKKFREDIL
ncbi:AraC family transcriptional regulator [Polaribacter sp. Z014]|uniref:AraC family transcriptional regulator n=1 Tax=Polaribacter sp. Z014 TaxID=2927126 RepID=UPI0020221147|nr:AraC family transcriptional regulator [Polaribacter sp. Z014]MCL7762962.1 AraC family transcriptional regulator [Polaribacter sp. Z014]